jgi:hypothetical protein
MVGILVHGNTHYILRGPKPTDQEALALARNWAIVVIGESKSPSFGNWQIREKEFRENLEWAVVLPGERAISAGVATLLSELAERGVEIRRCESSPV